MLAHMLCLWQRFEKRRRTNLAILFPHVTFYFSRAVVTACVTSTGLIVSPITKPLPVVVIGTRASIPGSSSSGEIYHCFSVK